MKQESSVNLPSLTPARLQHDLQLLVGAKINLLSALLSALAEIA